ncbi:unnamed protein product, partial [Symbiodinium microadriaticum]
MAKNNHEDTFAIDKQLPKAEASSRADEIGEVTDCSGNKEQKPTTTAESTPSPPDQKKRQNMLSTPSPISCIPTPTAPRKKRRVVQTELSPTPIP